ncbi:MAG TPA: T9SS type A sorting domain-containing protein [bacterium]|nr:T9SS type A sorting domain-containing protein [bacterium]
MNRHKLLFFLGSLCLLTAHSQAATWYVATPGAGLQNGTSLANAWPTIQDSVNFSGPGEPAPGDTVMIEPGTYNENVQVNLSGTLAGGNVTLIAANGPGTVFVGNGDTSYSGSARFEFFSRNYVTIEDLDVADTNNGAFMIEDSCAGISILNNNIHHISGSNAFGVEANTYGTGNAISALTVSGNTFSDFNNSQGQYPAKIIALEGVVTNSAVDNNTLTSCNAYYNAIDIDCDGGAPSGITVEGNHLTNTVCDGGVTNPTDPGGSAIFLDGASNSTVTGNSVGDTSGWGIQVGYTGSGPGGTGGNNNLVSNNIVWGGTQSGLNIGTYGNCNGNASNNKILNNTLYGNCTGAGNTEGEIVISSGSTVSNDNTFENNIVYAANPPNTFITEGTTGGGCSAAPTNTVFDHNDYYSSSAATGLFKSYNGTTYTGLTGPTGWQSSPGSPDSSGSIAANPLFINATPGSPADFYLQCSSPDIDAGANEPSVLGDYAHPTSTTWRPINSIWDIGAYEVPACGSSPTDTPSSTDTPTATDSPTASPTKTFTASPSPTFTASPTRTSTPSPTNTASPTPTFTASPTRTSTPSPTDTTSLTDTPSDSPTRTSTPTFTASPTQSLTATASDSPTDSPTQTASPTPSFSPTQSDTFSPTDSFTATPTDTPTYSATDSPTQSVTFSATDSFTATSTDTPTYSATDSPTQSATFSATESFTGTPTATPSFSATDSPTQSDTFSPTNSLTATPTDTPTATDSPSFTSTRTWTQTATVTLTFTVSNTPEPEPYSVTVNIYNSAGEVVRNLYNGSSANSPNQATVVQTLSSKGGPQVDIIGLGGNAGNELIWNAANNGGQAVASGTYYIQITTTNNFGQVQTQSTTVSIVSTAGMASLAIFNSAGELVANLSESLSNESSLPVGMSLLLPPGKANAVISSPNSPSPALTITVTLADGSTTPVLWNGLSAQGQPLQPGNYVVTLAQAEPGSSMIIKSLAFALLDVKSGAASSMADSAQVLPNPVAGNAFTVKYQSDGTDMAVATMYNLDGQRVAEGADASGNLQMSGSWSAGVYLLDFEVHQGSGVLARHWIKVAVVH